MLFRAFLLHRLLQLQYINNVMSRFEEYLIQIVYQFLGSIWNVNEEVHSPKTEEEKVLSSLKSGVQRIVGGTETPIKEIPYMVGLLQNTWLFCSGSIVSSFYVVSAAHCLFR